VISGLQRHLVVRPSNQKTETGARNLAIWRRKSNTYLTFIGPCIVIYSYSKTNQMHLFLQLFIPVKHSKCFGRSFRPSSGAQDCTYNNRHMSNNCCYLPLFDVCLLLYVQAWAPDDGQKDRPKHVECFTGINKCEKLVHLVGFTIGI
jgi:hypothetical protein